MALPPPPVGVKGYRRLFNLATGEIADSTLVRLEGLSPDSRKKIKSALRAISRNPEGNKLLTRITRFYNEMVDSGVASHLTFKPHFGSAGKTSFSARCESDEVRLTVEIADTDESEYPVLYETRDSTVAAIDKARTPFWITLAHELIHLKHYLEEQCQYDRLKKEKIEELQKELEGEGAPLQKDPRIIRKSIAMLKQDAQHQQLLAELFFRACSEPSTVIKHIPYSIAKEQMHIENVLLSNGPLIQQLKLEQRQQLIESLIELQELRINMTELWPNLEERRTVLGSGSRDDISEASIRQAAGMPTRYIYQQKTIKSLESIATIRRILGEVGIIFEIPPVQDLQAYCSEGGVVSELTSFSLLIRKGVTQEQIDHQLAAQENPFKKRAIAEMHSRVKEFQRLHPSLPSPSSPSLAVPTWPSWIPSKERRTKGLLASETPTAPSIPLSHSPSEEDKEHLTVVGEGIRPKQSRV